MPVRIKKIISFQLFVLSSLFFLCLIFLAPLSYALERSSYEIDASVDTAAHMIKARQKVTFVNNSDKGITEVYFHIYPNRKYSESEKRFLLRYAAYFKVEPFPEGFQEGRLKINAATSGSSELEFKVEGEDETILKVKLKNKLSPGETVVIDLDFAVNIPHAYGRYGWHENIISLLRWYPMLSVLDKEGWHNYPFYPYHQPYFQEASNYNIRLRLPTEQVAAHSGILKNELDNYDGTKTLIMVSEEPLRDFGMCISPDFKIASRQINGVKINSYYMPKDETCAVKALEYASDLMKYYAQEFIPYPYKEFNIAPAFLGYGGTQSSNFILIDTRAYQLPGFLSRYFEFLVAHEAGHQWFYNLVGSDEYRQMFIDEGFNSYFILRYFQDKYGRDAKVMVLPKGLDWVMPNFSFSRAQLDRYSFVAKNGLDRPVLGELSSFQEPSAIFSIAYGKGSKIVDMLNYVMGDSAFERFIKRYFNEFSFKNISVNNIKDLASQEKGEDLSWFFDVWLNKDLVCDYAVSRVSGNKIYLKNLGEITMPVEIEVKLSDGKVLHYLWNDKEKIKEISVDTDKRIASVNIDPEKRILDMDRTNNNYRRKVDVRAVALYHPLYEIPAFLKDDAYSVVIGPQLGTDDLGLKYSLQKPQDNILYFSHAYNLGEEKIKNAVGFEQRHLGGRLLKWGWEGFAYDGKEGGDQEGFKLYLRKELWPVSYGLLDENDHITLYLLRERDTKSALSAGGIENINHLYYRQQEEAIWGLNLKLGRYGTYPDPSFGWKFNSTLENAEHFLGGQLYYWRFSQELSRYLEVDARQKIAIRVKLGLGYPQDKGLFQIGGEKGLRGYGYKTINGAQAIMLNIEHRFDIINNLNYTFWQNLFSLKKIQGVGFFDIGKSWFASFNDRGFKKDAGLGLRFHFDVIGNLEIIILKLDVAKALNDPGQDTHIWLGINHSF